MAFHQPLGVKNKVVIDQFERKVQIGILTRAKVT